MCLRVNVSEILTFVPDQGDDGLDIGLFVGLLHHAEPILQILKALIVGDVVNQEDPLHETTTELAFTDSTCECLPPFLIHLLRLHSDIMG